MEAESGQAQVGANKSCAKKMVNHHLPTLVGGFKPSEKYKSVGMMNFSYGKIGFMFQSPPTRITWTVKKLHLQTKKVASPLH